jgi:hypothetical protein
MISSLMNDLQIYLQSQLNNSFKINIAVKTAANNYPFGSYKILRSEFEQPHQKIRTRELNNVDNTLKVKSYYASKTVVQINFYNKVEDASIADDSLDEILSIAQKSWMWLNEDGRDKLSSANMVISFTSPQITQEEKLDHIDGVCRVGFDFTLKKVLEHQSNIEIIKTVSITDDKENYTIEIDD